MFSTPIFYKFIVWWAIFLFCLPYVGLIYFAIILCWSNVLTHSVNKSDVIHALQFDLYSLGRFGLFLEQRGFSELPTTKCGRLSLPSILQQKWMGILSSENFPPVHFYPLKASVWFGSINLKKNKKNMHFLQHCRYRRDRTLAEGFAILWFATCHKYPNQLHVLNNTVNIR
jgi:hypothetical protein